MRLRAAGETAMKRTEETETARRTRKKAKLQKKLFPGLWAGSQKPLHFLPPMAANRA
jgi:hypothetical protein